MRPVATRTRKLAVWPFRLAMWGLAAYLAIYGLVFWVRELGLLGLLFGGTLLPDLAIPFVAKWQHGAWPWPFIWAFAGALGCSAAVSILDPDSVD